MSETAGLCATCQHAQCAKHPRGGMDYWRCALAESDPRFAKYPRLPVLACTGYDRGANEERDQTPSGPAPINAQ